MRRMKEEKSSLQNIWNITTRTKGICLVLILTRIKKQA